MSNDLTNQCAFTVYMDRMSRMPERFESMKEAAENWSTVSDKVKKYYYETANSYSDLWREYREEIEK